MNRRPARADRATIPSCVPTRALPRVLLSGALAAALATTLTLAGCGDSPESLLAKAKASIEKKENKAAEIHLKNLLQKNDNAEARYLLGTIYLDAGDPRSAEKELRRALDAGFDAKVVVVPLTRALLLAGEPQKAIDEATRAAPATPEGQAALQTTVGRAQLALGKVDAGKAAFEAALAAKADYAPAQVGLITLKAASGDLKGAGADVDALLAKAPNAPEAMALKGDLLLAQGQPREARDFFLKVAAADTHDRQVRAKIVQIGIDLKDYEGAQKSLDELKKLAGPAPITQYLQAQLQYRQGQREAARDSIQNALKVAPDYLPAVALGAEIFLELNSPEQAERLSRQLVKAAPNSTLGYKLLGATYLRMNAPDKALEALKPALSAKTKDPGVYAVAGEAALRTNEPAKAADYFAQASKLDPDDPGKRAGLALAHLAGGEKERGLSELEAATKSGDRATQADLALIAAYLRDKQFDKALAAIDALEKKLPNSPVTANLRGAVLAAKGDLGGARKAYEAALERDPKFVAAASNLARLDLRDNKPDDAKKRFTTILEKDPKNVQAMLALSQLAQRPGVKEADAGRKEALDWLKKAREADPGSVPAVLALAGYYLANNQPKDALPMLQEAANANPENIAVLDALGTAYLRSDQQAQAMETFEKILRLRPESADLQLRMAQLKASQGDTAAALQHARKAVELAPDSPQPRIVLASLLVRDGKSAEAKKIAEGLKKDLPKSAAGLVLEADLLAVDKKWADAAASYRKALAVEKTVPIASRAHQALLRAGKDAEANALVADWLKASPNDLAMRQYVGDYEVSRQHWKEAVAQYEVITKAQPNNALALNNMAWAMNQLKDPRAVEVAQRAYALAPKAPAIADTLGVVLVDNGQQAQGVETLKQAVALAPKNPQFRLHLAQALAKAGDKDGARREAEAVVRDAPDSPSAKEAQALAAKL